MHVCFMYGKEVYNKCKLSFIREHLIFKFIELFHF